MTTISRRKFLRFLPAVALAPLAQSYPPYTDPWDLPEAQPATVETVAADVELLKSDVLMASVFVGVHERRIDTIEKCFLGCDPMPPAKGSV